MKDNALPKISHASENTMIEMVRTLMAIMEQRDASLKNHCERVANNCANFCESAHSCSEEEVKAIFFAGVLHDIGKALLLKAFTDISQSEFLNIDVVKDSLQEGHVSLGAGLLKRWGFGDEFITVISHHEDIEFNPKTGKELLVIHLANMLTRNIGYSLFDNEIDIAELESAKLLEIDAEALEKIGEEVKKIIRDLEDTF